MAFRLIPTADGARVDFVLRRPAGEPVLTVLTIAEDRVLEDRDPVVLAAGGADAER